MSITLRTRIRADLDEAKWVYIKAHTEIELNQNAPLEMPANNLFPSQVYRLYNVFFSMQSIESTLHKPSILKVNLNTNHI